MPTIALTEKNIQAAVMDWLNSVPGVRVWRQNVGIKSRRAHRQTRPHQALFRAHGVKLQVEIKRPGEVPTPDQTHWIEFINFNGGIAFWCDSLRSCVQQLRAAYSAKGWPWSPRWEVW